MNKFIDSAKQAFNYRLTEDGVPHMQVKECLAIIAISAAFVGGSAYVGQNVPSIVDWFENTISTDEGQDTGMSSAPRKTLG
jgi:hypothetical protein